MDTSDILIVEDDRSLLEVTCDYLTDQGYSVRTCTSGSAAIELLKKTTFKLVVLDINLPDLLGFDVCRIIRKTLKVPIIFLSARISDMDKVTGLDLGADDYISKPYSLNELPSRIKALIRRTYDYSAQGNATNDIPEVSDNSFHFGDVEVNFDSRKVLVGGVEKEFPAKEFDLLAYLIKHRDKSISKETLYNSIWDYDSMGEINTLSVHIRRIREKIEKDPCILVFLTGLILSVTTSIMKNSEKAFDQAYSKMEGPHLLYLINQDKYNEEFKY